MVAYRAMLSRHVIHYKRDLARLASCILTPLFAAAFVVIIDHAVRSVLMAKELPLSVAALVPGGEYAWNSSTPEEVAHPARSAGTGQYRDATTSAPVVVPSDFYMTAAADSVPLCAPVFAAGSGPDPERNMGGVPWRPASAASLGYPTPSDFLWAAQSSAHGGDAAGGAPPSPSSGTALPRCAGAVSCGAPPAASLDAGLLDILVLASFNTSVDESSAFGATGTARTSRVSAAEIADYFLNKRTTPLLSFLRDGRFGEPHLLSREPSSGDRPPGSMTGRAAGGESGAKAPALPALLRLTASSLARFLLGPTHGLAESAVRMATTRVAETASYVFRAFGPVALAYGIALPGASIATRSVAERYSGARGLQAAAGARPTEYWIAEIGADAAVISAGALAALMTLLAGGVSAVASASVVCTVPVFLLYVVCVAICAQLAASPFDREETAARWLGWFVTLLVFVPYGLRAALFHGSPSLGADAVLSLSPAYAFHEAVAEIADADAMGAPLSATALFNPSLRFGRFCVFLAVEAAVYFVLVVALEAARRKAGGFPRFWTRASRAPVTGARAGGWQPLEVRVVDRGQNSSPGMDAYAPLDSPGTGGGSVELASFVDRAPAPFPSAAENPGARAASSAAAADTLARPAPDDVAAEEARVDTVVSENGVSDFPVLLCRARKVYPGKPVQTDEDYAEGVPAREAAVLGISLAVARGRCLGLLGGNGAGKSTTMSMLAGTVSPTSGIAMVCGDRVSSLGPFQPLSGLGVCPQKDALWLKLTAREHLDYYAALRGVPPASRREHVSDILAQVGLEPADCDLRVSKLSGGNRRKVSIAIALVGCSLGLTRAILLDEPTSGLDTMSRRAVWDAIDAARSEHGVSVVLCTHNLEEATRLTQRIAIMADGAVRCIGTAAQLRERFGGGYRLEVSIAPGANADHCHDFVSDTFPGSQYRSQWHGKLLYEIPDFDPARPGAALADAFEALEMRTWRPNVSSSDPRPERSIIRDYTLSVNTLERVFHDVVGRRRPRFT